MVQFLSDSQLMSSSWHSPLLVQLMIQFELAGSSHVTISAETILVADVVKIAMVSSFKRERPDGVGQSMRVTKKSLEARTFFAQIVTFARSHEP